MKKLAALSAVLGITMMALIIFGYTQGLNIERGVNQEYENIESLESAIGINIDVPSNTAGDGAYRIYNNIMCEIEYENITIRATKNLPEGADLFGEYGQPEDENKYEDTEGRIYRYRRFNGYTIIDFNIENGNEGIRYTEEYEISDIMRDLGIEEYKEIEISDTADTGEDNLGKIEEAEGIEDDKKVEEEETEDNNGYKYYSTESYSMMLPNKLGNIKVVESNKEVSIIKGNELIGIIGERQIEGLDSKDIGDYVFNYKITDKNYEYVNIIVDSIDVIGSTIKGIGE